MKTVWIQFTAWDGFWIDRTLFGPVLHLGWIGVGSSSWVLTHWIDKWYRAILRAEGAAK